MNSKILFGHNRLEMIIRCPCRTVKWALDIWFQSSKERARLEIEIWAFYYIDGQSRCDWINHLRGDRRGKVGSNHLKLDTMSLFPHL